MTKKIDPTRCIEQVFSATGGYSARQCNKPKGHGTDGQYCTAHARSTKDIEPSKVKRDRGDKLWR